MFRKRRCTALGMMDMVRVVGLGITRLLCIRLFMEREVRVGRGAGDVWGLGRGGRRVVVLVKVVLMTDCKTCSVHVYISDLTLIAIASLISLSEQVVEIV